LVFTPYLPLTLSAILASGCNTPRLVVFSSNNVAVTPEAPSYRAIAAAEAALMAHKTDAIVIRPTMIYGDPRLATVTTLMRRARAWPVLPTPGWGNALIQPVFCDDLGVLAAGLLSDPSIGGGTFAAGGPEAISMRGFFRAAARAAGAHPLIAPCPPALLRLAARFGAPIDAEQAARSERDRRVRPQDPIPPEYLPQTTLNIGLMTLAAALGYRATHQV
jgi:uncharacterized protein YbjT (DUF2867 family)